MQKNEVKLGEYYWKGEERVQVRTILPLEAQARLPIKVQSVETDHTSWTDSHALSVEKPLTAAEKLAKQLDAAETSIRQELHPDAFLSAQAKHRLAAEVTPDGGLSLTLYEWSTYEDGIDLSPEDAGTFRDWLLNQRKS